MSRQKNDLNKGKNIARYNLSLPQSLKDGLQQIADDEGENLITIIRKFIKLGLLAVNAEKNGGRIILENGNEKTVIKML